MRSIAVVLAALICVVTADITTLVPFRYIERELIGLDTESKPYRLAGLKPSTGYEVRLSWPASIPATIKFELIDSAADQGGLRGTLSSRTARRLLDCEKFVFHTDDQASVQGFKDPQVVISAFRRSVHKNGRKAGVTKIVYNIVLAEVIFGLPTDIVPVVAAVLLSVVFAFIWSIYWSGRIYPWLLMWLTTPDGYLTPPIALPSNKRDS